MLANALENALNACQEIPTATDRYIHLTAELTDQRKLIIAVANPCSQQLIFDADGFPIVPEKEGHGIGLRSISTIVQKYHGLFHCECQEGEFHLHAVLFDQPEPKFTTKKSSLTAKIASSAGICLLAFAVLINCIPTIAQALSEMPGLGTLVRLAITLPLLAVGALLTQVNFDIIWRYFSWSNQTLAMITLWAAAMYLVRNAQKWLMCALPAAFMSGVSSTYILMAEEGFQISQSIAYPVGIVFSLACFLLYLVKAISISKQQLRTEP